MPRAIYQHFNRGEIDDLALGRDDVDRVRDSAALMENWMPVRLGPMKTRGGLEFMTNNNVGIYNIPFVRNINSKFIFSSTGVIFQDGEPVLTESSTSSLTNPDFAGNLSGWTSDVGGGDSGIDGGDMYVVSDGATEAIVYQTASTQETSQTWRIRTNTAPITIKLGTDGVDSNDIFEGVVNPGDHFFTFDPSDPVTITFGTRREYRSKVQDVTIYSTEIPINLTANTTGERYSQSFDVMSLADPNGLGLSELRYYGDKSWSYAPTWIEDGPFGTVNLTPVTLDPQSERGLVQIDIGGGKQIFKSNDVGRLIKVSSTGQTVSRVVQSASTVNTNSIRITGVGGSRDVQVDVTAFPGSTYTVILQRSVDESTWDDVETYTSPTSITFNDGFDNVIYYYRLNVTLSTGLGVSGALTAENGSITGIGRIVEVNNGASPNIVVQAFQAFSPGATVNWYLSEWGGDNGYPTAVRHYEGRLWYAGNGLIWGSVSDGFSSFDDDSDLGDAASIRRFITVPSAGSTRWLNFTNRLVIGTDTDDIVVRSSSFDEIMTPFNTNLKSGSTQGASEVDCERTDSMIYYVQRSGRKIMGMMHSGGQDAPDITDLNVMNNDVTGVGIRRIAISRQPETRIYAVLNDGTAAVYTVDKSEDVSAWSRLKIGSRGENAKDSLADVVVLPATDEDEVYFITEDFEMLRMVNDGPSVASADKRLHFDVFSTYTTNGAGGVITVPATKGLQDGDTVHVRSIGQYIGEYVIAGGEIDTGENLPNEVQVGVPFVSLYKSNKISGFVDTSVLTKNERVAAVGMIGRNIEYDLFEYGKSLDDADLQNLPEIYKGRNASDQTSFGLMAEYDNQTIPFKGVIDTDSRVCIRTTGTATIMVLSYVMSESRSG